MPGAFNALGTGTHLFFARLSGWRFRIGLQTETGTFGDGRRLARVLIRWIVGQVR